MRNSTTAAAGRLSFFARKRKTWSFSWRSSESSRRKEEEEVSELGKPDKVGSRSRADFRTGVVACAALSHGQVRISWWLDRWVDG